MTNRWRPINTAPKDRRILLAYEYDDFTFPFLHQFFSRKKTYIDVGMYPSHMSLYIKGCECICRPVAWQELPEFDGVINK